MAYIKGGRAANLGNGARENSEGSEYGTSIAAGSLPPVSKEAISKYFGQQVSASDPHSIYDLNKDGIIDIRDLVAWGNQQQSGGPTPPQVQDLLSECLDRHYDGELTAEETAVCQSAAASGQRWTKTRTCPDGAGGTVSVPADQPCPDSRTSLPPVSKEAISKYFGQQVSPSDPHSIYDLNADGIIDIRDLVAWGNQQTSAPVNKYQFGQDLKSSQGTSQNPPFRLEVRGETNVFAGPSQGASLGVLYPSSTIFDAYEATPSDHSGLQWLRLSRHGDRWIQWGSNVRVTQRQREETTAARPAVLTCPDGKPMTDGRCACPNGIDFAPWEPSLSQAVNQASVSHFCQGVEVQRRRRGSSGGSLPPVSRESIAQYIDRQVSASDPHSIYDLNKDGVIDIFDLVAWENQQQATAPVKQVDPQAEAKAEKAEADRIAKAEKAKDDLMAKAAREKKEAEDKAAKAKAEADRLAQDNLALQQRLDRLAEDKRQANAAEQQRLANLEKKLSAQQLKQEKSLLQMQQQADQLAVEATIAQEKELAVAAAPLASFAAQPALSPMVMVGGAAAVALLLLLGGR